MKMNKGGFKLITIIVNKSFLYQINYLLKFLFIKKDRACDTKDWSNDAENSASLSQFFFFLHLHLCI